MSLRDTNRRAATGVPTSPGGSKGSTNIDPVLAPGVDNADTGAWSRMELKSRDCSQ